MNRASQGHTVACTEREAAVFIGFGGEIPLPHHGESATRAHNQ
jgi:hypothetical protein